MSIGSHDLVLHADCLSELNIYFELHKVFNIIEHKQANTSLVTWSCSFYFASPKIDQSRNLFAYIYINLLQVRSLKEALAGALRRESTAENTIRELELQIEQLNELVISGDNKILFAIPTDKKL